MIAEIPDDAGDAVRSDTRVVCRHFLVGRCERGDQCRFLHPDAGESLGSSIEQLSGSPGVRKDFPRDSDESQLRPADGRIPSVCKHFLVGKCERGDECRFSHQVPDDYSVPGLLDSKVAPICRHFLVGKCDRGDECRFSHEASPDFVQPMDRSYIPSRGAYIEDRGICRHFLVGKCDRGDECRFSHQTSADIWQPVNGYAQPRIAVKEEGGVCRHFLAGKCDRGDECRFSHQTSPDTWQAVDNVYTLPRSALQEEAGVCRHFLVGRCERGDECRFSHPVELLRPMSHIYTPSPRDTFVDDRGVCRHFLVGRCERGNECRFSHQVPPHAVQPMERSYTPRGANVDDRNYPPHGAYVDDRSVCRHFLAGRCDREDCRFSHQVQQVQPSAADTANICRHFLVGKCERGDDCRFSHYDPRGPAVAHPQQRPDVPWHQITQPQTATGRTRMPEAPSGGRQSDACRHYLLGRCERGDDCRFAHPVLVDLPAGPVPKYIEEAGGEPQSTCRHFLEGKCSYGDACRFPHNGVPNVRSKPY